MNTNVALLGISSSGKTNFISEAIKDINSFSPKITIMPVDSTQTVDTGDIYNNHYMLKAYENIQWEFSICDYEGRLLKSHENDFIALKNVLYESDTWIILVDGTYFNGGEESDEKIIGKIKRSSARILIPYISDYAEEHNETMPELLFVVTKSNRLIGKFASDRIKHIIMKSFEGIFTEESSPMILLCETSYTKAAGLAVLSIFYIKYAKELSDRIAQLENRNKQIKRDISELWSLIYEIEDHKILGRLPANKRKVESYRRQIFSLETESSSNGSEIIQCRNNGGLEHLGICVQCLIDNNQQLIINGFDKIDYQYDKSLMKPIKSHWWIMVVLIFNLCVLGIMQILSKMHVQSDMSEWFVIGYVIWIILSVGLATALDKRRSRRFGPRFQNELVQFFYTRVKEIK